ncbi:MAG TPA: ribonuclease PH [Pirellulales bacterium]|nr:ribonuclease PH [Pirellulales bacterium]
MPRHDKRADNELRPLEIRRGFTRPAPGSVLIQAGRTTVLCTASVDLSVPPWLVGKGQGWVTAEYGMLPGSTRPRKRRDVGKVDGRTTEIQRLIGRSLRAVCNLEALGERTITLDCDVLEADGGTRTASITGAMVALVDAIRATPELAGSIGNILRDSVAAISVGIVDSRPVLDLDYVEDSAASVDMNVVLTGRGQFVEVQGSGEEATFSQEELDALVALARGGIEQLRVAQRAALGIDWPFGS